METKTLKIQSQAKQDKLRLVKFIASLMDDYFTIPGTNIRFGLDPILGMIPLAGQVPTLAISMGLVFTMYKYGASNKLIIKMLFNTLIDALLGSIPLIGTIFDFAFKANTRNVKLIEEHYLENKHQGSGRNFLFIAMFIIFILLSLFLYLIYIFSSYLYHLIF